ncbi:restriction endonuclease [Streptomyces dubilierae]|uniref:Restriction endonuclease n=1 Tax=Streptomyces dubilierae TaxID=3075533 RepID=A0ABU2P2K6_9ACTN|nr:restriction endonuclease [Streptomyces sp. DSM 41921]MDT0386372.1 restriction endonuclease [Streptomyces sp. DSM 41921]
MTAPTRPLPPVNRRRRFDLRSTALFFVFLAVVLCVLGLSARMVADAVERRPAWMFVLAVLGVAGCVGLRRRIHVARAARRAAAALDRAAREAADELDALQPRPGRPAVEVVTDHGALPAAEFETVAGHGATVPVEFETVIDYDGLTPEEFEEAVAALCERDGCSAVEVVGGAGDLGADVLALTPDGRRIVIQCKYYDVSHRVGSQDLQRFGGTCFTVHEADVAALVTTSDFTAPALEYAEQCGIVCVDGEALRAWTDGTGPRPWDTAPGGRTAGWDLAGAGS